MCQFEFPVEMKKIPNKLTHFGGAFFQGKVINTQERPISRYKSIASIFVDVLFDGVDAISVFRLNLV